MMKAKVSKRLKADTTAKKAVRSEDGPGTTNQNEMKQTVVPKSGGKSTASRGKKVATPTTSTKITPGTSAKPDAALAKNVATKENNPVAIVKEESRTEETPLLIVKQETPTEEIPLLIVKQEPQIQETPLVIVKEEHQIEEIPLVNQRNSSEYIVEDASSLLECVLKGNEVRIENDQDLQDLSSDDCDLQFKRTGGNRKPREYACPQCPKVFKKKWDLKQHLHIHEGMKPYQCEHCLVSFASKSNLISHVKRHNEERSFECHYCTRSFASTNERDIHERSHTGERPYVCELCGKDYTAASHLSNHQRREHLDEGNFVCDICEKRFIRASQLRMHHSNVHSEVPRNHICTICNAAFKKKITLTQHLRIHREKTYKCLECGKKFAQHSGLYSHRKIHEKQRESLLTEKIKQENSEETISLIVNDLAGSKLKKTIEKLCEEINEDVDDLHSSKDKASFNAHSLPLSPSSATVFSISPLSAGLLLSEENSTTIY
uniref:C2H2-type domain-containing protein n=1 Tax=Glossina morsitans morsitans TaxID=37546 RepID=A0A1B0FCU8_GLOMM